MILDVGKIRLSEERHRKMRTRDALIRELLDAPQVDAQALALNLRDIRRINTVLGWTAYSVKTVAGTVRNDHLRSFSLLDVASGSADMPLAIARWSRQEGIPAHIVATDISDQIVAVARKQAAGEPIIVVEKQDALHLPYDDRAFDIVLCTLALHHFDPGEAIQLLRGMARVSNKVILVFDVVRSPLTYWGAVLLTRGLRMHPMTRHDAPISVRRAYSAPELRRLAEQAGLGQARVRVSVPFRLALSARHS
jgi:2-polyprenyl-3-methyl-5-hydroxy-6-metoxy-1,4-benzoquinol methylase